MSYVIEIYLHVDDEDPPVGRPTHSRHLDQAHWDAVEAAQAIFKADERLKLLRTAHGVRRAPTPIRRAGTS